MKHITYLIGAGASCKSQPLVSNMKERMNLLLQMLNCTSLCSGLLDKNLRDSKNKLYNKYKDTVSESFMHYTPDTYAKKLWLTNKQEKLVAFKEFLNLYFIFEQHFNIDNTIWRNLDAKFDKTQTKGDKIYEIACEFTSLSNDYFRNDIVNKHSAPDEYQINKTKFFKNLYTYVDYRFDVFYATLLKVQEEKNPEEHLILPKEINIISWNYDNQFELAYKPYTNGMNYEDVRKNLNINPTTYDPKKSHIIKLNGECNIKDLDGDNDGFLTFTKALEMLLKGKSIENLIKFAWEKETSGEKTNIVNKIMENTDELIIIGYSFPNFNREVDFKNIKKFSILQDIEKQKFNKIVIQVPDKKEFEKINDRVTAFINPEILSNVNFPITHIEDTDQFYIPMI